MYELLSGIAGTWGLLFLLVLFLAAVAYAFWPGNKRKFDRAKHLPLEDERPGKVSSLDKDHSTADKAPAARDKETRHE